MRKRKVYYGRRGQGPLHLPRRTKRARIAGGMIRDDAERADYARR